MQRYLIVLIIFLGIDSISISVFAQTQAEIDDLNEKAFQLRNKNLDSSFFVAKQAYDASVKLNYRSGKGAAQVNMGNYYRISRPDTSLVLLRYALDDLEKTGEKKFSAIAHWYMAKIFNALSAFQKAIAQCDLAHQQLENTNEHYLIASIWNEKAIIEGKQSNYVQALDCLDKAYRIKLDHSLPADIELSNIALVYNRMGDVQKARAILFKQLRLSSDSAGFSSIYNTLGATYEKDRMLDSAIFFFEQALTFAAKEHDLTSEVIALSNLASVYISQGNTEKAKNLLKSALKLTKTNDQYVNQMIYVELSRLYQNLQQPDSCIKYGSLGLKITQATNAKGYSLQLAGILSDSYEQKNDLKKSLQYHKLKTAYKDSIATEEDKKEYNDIRVRIETFEKEKEIDLLKKQQLIDKVQIQFFVFISIASVVISLLIAVFFLYRNRMTRKNNEIANRLLQDQLKQKEKDLITQKLHMIHRYNAISEIEDEIKKISKTESVDTNEKYKNLMSVIFVSKSLDKDWETFNTYFNNVHHDFLDKLTARFKNLSVYEQRLCMMLKLKLTTREIASLLNIEVTSVKTSKYRLKKKLHLDESQEIEEVLNSLEESNQIRLGG